MSSEVFGSVRKQVPLFAESGQGHRVSVADTLPSVMCVVQDPWQAQWQTHPPWRTQLDLHSHHWHNSLECTTERWSFTFHTHIMVLLQTLCPWLCQVGQFSIGMNNLVYQWWSSSVVIVVYKATVTNWQYLLKVKIHGFVRICVNYVVILSDLANP